MTSAVESARLLLQSHERKVEVKNEISEEERKCLRNLAKARQMLAMVGNFNKLFIH